jgi:CxxC motif-containing protein (DUF1111 family)
MKTITRTTLWTLIMIFADWSAASPGDAHGPVAGSVVSGEAVDQLAPTTLEPSEAPTGFDGASNGLVDEETHAADRSVFDEAEDVDEGLGPVYNAQACRECHQSPISGAGSQITELRVGHFDFKGRFVNPVIPLGDGSVVTRGRSLVNDRAVCPGPEFPDQTAQGHVPPGERVRALRASLNVLGDGFVEAVPSSTLRAIASDQCQRSSGAICGQVVLVPVLEAGGLLRVGRFGWKGQHASLLSFAADAYLNEMGITSTLAPQDVTSLCDAVADPEDEIGPDGLGDVDRFARFMRATQPPGRDEALAASQDAQAGSNLFDQTGCAICHVRTLVTAPAGSVVNAGALEVPEALGNRSIHPFSDFLLHDVGTGDGIVQNGGQSSAQKLRTPPLWGLRTRERLMHDGLSLGARDAILRHRGEARGVVDNYKRLTAEDQGRLLTFLRSL